MGDAWAYGLKRGMLEAVMRLSVTQEVRGGRLCVGSHTPPQRVAGTGAWVSGCRAGGRNGMP